MSDEKRIQLNEFSSISVDDWKKIQHDLEENKMRLDFYFKTSSSRYDELHKMRSDIAKLKSWKDSLMFWMKLVAWGVFIVVSMFLIHAATFVLSNKEIKNKYLNWSSSKLNGVE